MMKIGLVTSVITPPVGTRLSGFMERVGNSVGVYDDLLLQTLALKAGAARALLIAADVIAFGDQFVDEVKARLREAYDLPSEAVFMVCSHTHSGPHLPHGLPEPSPNAYVRGLVERIVADAGAALDRAHTEVRVTYGQDRAGFAINRRKPNAAGKIEMYPNPDEPRDEAVPVVQLVDASDQPRVVLFSYACHADVLRHDNNMISADYPGAARRFIEQHMPGAAAIYLPGCEGDIDPHVIGTEGAFRGEFHGTYDDVIRLGEDLGAAVLRACAQAVPVQADTLAGVASEIMLPLSQVPPLSHFQQMAAADHSQRPPWEPDWGDYARFLLADPATRLQSQIPLRLQRLDLGAEITLLGIGAEISAAYGLTIKAAHTDRCVIPVGYANGQVAYIATADQIRQGGYEVELGNVWFGLPAPLAPEAEDVVLRGVESILDRQDCI